MHCPQCIETYISNEKGSDYAAAKKDGLDKEQLDKLVDKNVLALNAELAAYSKIGYTEIREEQFEKTPKQSIRRFMYS